MSYPPPGGYPNYPNAQGGGGPGIGFGNLPKPGEGAGYSPYPPQSSGSFGSDSGYPPSGGQTYSQPYSYGAPSGPSGPQNTISPYSQTSSYGAQSGASSYPPLGGGGGSNPYPSAPSGGSYPYPPSSGGGSGYPPSGGSMYPSSGSGPYAPSSGTGPYPPQGGAQGPYPPQGAGFPMPTSGAQNPYGGASAPQSVYGAPMGQSPYGPPAGQNPYGPPGSSPYSSSSGSMHGRPPTNYSMPSAGGYGSLLNPYTLRPTVRPAVSFDPSSDAAALKKAMKGLGTDEKAIIQVLARRTSHQRQQIMLKYQQAYGKDLTKALKSELSGQFEDVILALMTPLPVYLAKEVNGAITGIGTKESVLIEILCTRDNVSIRDIKAAYHNLFHAQLEQHIKDDTSGDFKRILISMSTGHRDEHNMDTSQAPTLAQSLYKAGEGKWGTEESEFRRIMSTYSYPVLRCVFEEYRKLTGHPFDKAINSELSGDFRDAMLAIYHSIMNQAAFFANQLRNAMKGMGTKDDTLVRIVVSRCEIDMGNIKDEYKKAHGKRLEEAISSETSGDYKKVLLALIQD